MMVLSAALPPAQRVAMNVESVVVSPVAYATRALYVSQVAVSALLNVQAKVVVMKMGVGGAVSLARVVQVVTIVFSR